VDPNQTINQLMENPIVIESLPKNLSHGSGWSQSIASERENGH
jgi:hypothetical protein